MTDLSTYVRKIADGQYEYGFVIRSKNFRKRPDVYRTVGTSGNLVDAEYRRGQLITITGPEIDLLQWPKSRDWTT